MFEFEFNNSELDALNVIVETSVKSEANLLPSWTYMGLDVWTMDFDMDAMEATPDWAFETADVV